MYALVRDRTPANQRLPLREVVDALVRRSNMSRATPVTVTMACGYGVRVNELDDGTEAGGTVSTSIGGVLAIVDADDEWFYELRVNIGAKLAFGLLDSSAVVVEGERSIVLDVVQGFHEVSVHDGNLLLAQ